MDFTRWEVVRLCRTTRQQSDGQQTAEQLLECNEIVACSLELSENKATSCIIYPAFSTGVCFLSTLFLLILFYAINVHPIQMLHVQPALEVLAD